MKKVGVFMLAWCILLYGCAADGAPSSAQPAASPSSVLSAAPTPSDEAEALKTQLAKASGEEVLHFLCEDLDGDGKQEAFGLVGDMKNQQLLTGWFASAKGAQKVTEQGHVNALLRENGTGNAMDVYALGGGQRCVVLESGGTTGSNSFIFTVKDGQAVQSSISPMQFQQETNGDFTGLYSTYGSQYMVMDGKKSFMGHTWNPYWFYWDGKEFQEYVGTEMTTEELMGYDGAREIVEARLAVLNEEGKPMDLTWKILNVYRRDNGIINVNYGSDYATGGDRCCDNLRVNGKAVALLVSPDPGLSGYYVASMLKGK